MRTLRVALAQINTTVGDLAGNTAKILEWIGRAREWGPTSWPSRSWRSPATRRRTSCCGARSSRTTWRPSTRSCARRGHHRRRRLRRRRRRHLQRRRRHPRRPRWSTSTTSSYLPNYGVFDEDRYFRAGDELRRSSSSAGVGVGVNICEDIWYPDGPDAAAGAGRRPGHREHQRLALPRRQAAASASGCSPPAPRDNAVIVCYVNLVGGQDELVFDGSSMIFDPEGETAGARHAVRGGPARRATSTSSAVFRRPACTTRAAARSGSVAPATCDRRGVRISSSPLPPDKPPLPPTPSTPLDGVAEVYAALVLGTRDYVRKNGFKKVVIGLSGGIDSSLVAAIAVDALGPENVIGVSMPSRYSSEGSRDDAAGAGRRTWASAADASPSRSAFTAYLDMLAEPFAGTEPGRRRGEPAGAHPRQHPDGPLQQVRLAGADHRQQERDGHRLLRPSTATWPAASP